MSLCWIKQLAQHNDLFCNSKKFYSPKLLNYYLIFFYLLSIIIHSVPEYKYTTTKIGKGFLDIYCFKNHAL